MWPVGFDSLGLGTTFGHIQFTLTSAQTNLSMLVFVRVELRTHATFISTPLLRPARWRSLFVLSHRVLKLRILHQSNHGTDLAQETWPLFALRRRGLLRISVARVRLLARACAIMGLGCVDQVRAARNCDRRRRRFELRGLLRPRKCELMVACCFIKALLYRRKIICARRCPSMATEGGITVVLIEGQYLLLLQRLFLVESLLFLLSLLSSGSSFLFNTSSLCCFPLFALLTLRRLFFLLDPSFFGGLLLFLLAFEFCSCFQSLSDRSAPCIDIFFNLFLASLLVHFFLLDFCRSLSDLFVFEGLFAPFQVPLFVAAHADSVVIEARGFGFAGLL